jgi:hypothetical protein
MGLLGRILRSQSAFTRTARTAQGCAGERWREPAEIVKWQSNADGVLESASLSQMGGLWARSVAGIGVTFV